MENNKCNIHTISQTITDQDLSSLFNGLMDVVKKKYELDFNAKIINLNKKIEILSKLIKQKDQEILSLRSNST